MFSKINIEKFSKLQTPFYYYDLPLLNKTLETLKEAADKNGYVVHYAFKANSNDKILRIIKNYGFGADCVSGNEVLKAVETGFKNKSIVFAGVGKSDEEIKTALSHDIFCFNVESIQELEVIDEIAGTMNKKAGIALRINPNVNAKTHHYITTGLEENKFGINPWEFDAIINKLNSLKNLKLIGLHFHIGSQVTDPDVFKGLCIRVNEVQQWFNDHHITFEHINVGGGLGVNYENPDKSSVPDFNSFFNIFNKFLKLQPGQSLHFELGRTIAAQCGSLISKVLYVKDGVNKKFVILDAGMTELIRPALYQAYHKIENLSSNGKKEKYDVVGPICETSDTFGKAVLLPQTKRGDLIVIRSAGAYGEVMSSRYNLRDPVRSVYSDEI
jgi:diaminopimelate decarboxylase